MLALNRGNPVGEKYELQESGMNKQSPWIVWKNKANKTKQDIGLYISKYYPSESWACKNSPK